VDTHPLIIVGVTVTAALTAAIAVPLAGGVAAALARRGAVALPPLGQWRACLTAQPRSAGLAALVGGLLAMRWSTAPLAAAAMLAAVGVAVLAAMVDVRCHRLPNVLVGPLALVLVVVVATSAVVRAEPQRLGAALLAGAGSGILLGVGWIVGMGLGDVKFGAALGVLVGWPVGSWSGAMLAALGVVGGAATAASVWWGWSTLRRRSTPRWFPFGPFLAAAAVLVLFATGPPGAAATQPESSSGQRWGTGSPCTPGSPVDSGGCSASSPPANPTAVPSSSSSRGCPPAWR